MNREDIIKAIAACAEYECGSCPYQKYDDPFYKLQCQHRLMLDISEMFKPKKTIQEKDDVMLEHHCPVCGNFIGYTNILFNEPKISYCSKCGQMITN